VTTVPPPPPATKLPRKETSHEPSVSRAPVYGPKETLTLNVHLRNANAWPGVQERLKALLDSPKGQVKLDLISGDYYWVAVAPVKGEADAFARRINFARVVSVHNPGRLIYLDMERLPSPQVPAPIPKRR
jgi:hypothetical protein